VQILCVPFGTTGCIDNCCSVLSLIWNGKVGKQEAMEVISNEIQSIRGHAHQEMENRNPKIRAVNLGGWLVTEGWIEPSLFDAIPNKDFLVLCYT